MVRVSETKRSSLHAKLAEVGQAVTHVEKDGKNSFHKYDYASATAVLAAIRKPLFERGVTVTPSVERVDDREYTTAGGKASVVTTVTVKFTFVDSETGEREEHVWAGRGDDNADKGLSKAYTSAVKTFILEAFLLPTGDDPEADAETDKRAAQRQPSPPPPAVPDAVVENVAKEAVDAKAAGVDLREAMGAVGAQPQKALKQTIRSMTPEQVERFRSLVAEAKSKLGATEVK